MLIKNPHKQWQETESGFNVFSFQFIFFGIACIFLSRTSLLFRNDKESMYYKSISHKSILKSYVPLDQLFSTFFSLSFFLSIFLSTLVQFLNYCFLNYIPKDISDEQMGPNYPFSKIEYQNWDLNILESVSEYALLNFVLTSRYASKSVQEVQSMKLVGM